MKKDYFLKNCVNLFAALVIVLSIWGSKSVICTKADDNAQLLRMLESKTSATVREIYYKDLNDDGKEEAVAITSKKYEQSYSISLYDNAKIWYITDSDCILLDTVKNMYVYSDTATITPVKNGYLFYYEGGVQSTWTLSNAYFFNKTKHEKVKNVFSQLTYIGDNQFTQIHSTYDSAYDKDLDSGIGHTFKPYWFYWDGEKLVEYGGTKVSQSWVNQHGGKKILKKIKKMGKIRSIYYRKNGIVNISYIKKDKDSEQNFNITLELINNKLKYYKINTYGKSKFSRAQSDGYYISHITTCVNCPERNHIYYTASFTSKKSKNSGSINKIFLKGNQLKISGSLVKYKSDNDYANNKNSKYLGKKSRAFKITKNTKYYRMSYNYMTKKNKKWFIRKCSNSKTGKNSKASLKVVTKNGKVTEITYIEK